MSERHWKLTGLILLCGFVSIQCFLYLDYCGAYRWDESRNAVNALEMADGGNPLGRTYGGAPDHWETKPPMLIWNQVFWIKLIGPSELALRLPSALSGLALAVMIFLFLSVIIKDPKAGVFAVVILFTSDGYVRPHVLRTGDHDAMLLFFLTGGAFAWFAFLECRRNREHSPEFRRGPVLFTGFSISGAVLTKSITGFFLLPGMFLYTVFSRSLKSVVSYRWFYYAVILAAIPIAAYYIGRTHFDPGYLYWVNENELFRRYTNTSSEYGYNTSPFLYYFHLLADRHFNNWIWFLPAAAIPFLRNTLSRLQRFQTYLFVLALSFLLLISLGTTNDWYDAPVIPLLAMLLGIGFSQVLKYAEKGLPILAGKHEWPVFILICIATAAYPWYETLDRQIIKPKPDHHDMAYGNFLRNTLSPDLKNDPIGVLSECNNAHVDYYAEVYSDYKGYSIYNRFLCTEDPNAIIQELPEDSYFIVCNPGFRNSLTANWNLQVLKESGTCELVKTISRKLDEAP